MVVIDHKDLMELREREMPFNNSFGSRLKPQVVIISHTSQTYSRCIDLASTLLHVDLTSTEEIRPVPNLVISAKTALLLNMTFGF